MPTSAAGLAAGFNSPAFYIMLVVGFAAGSLPFSVWTGRLLLPEDIRRYGDANPGATNVFRAGRGGAGKVAGVIAVLLDGFKSAIPVGIAWLWLGLDGAALALVAVAPVAGHAWSPFLGFRGGKAVASSAGTWAGLTIWEGPTLMGLGLYLATRVWKANGWAVMAAMVLMLGWLLLTPPSWNGLGVRPPASVMLMTWTLNMAILIW
ncbi:MAG: glycerol-3-phosphate acyltransferase, partial [Caldilineaceae bacterium]